MATMFSSDRVVSEYCPKHMTWAIMKLSLLSFLGIRNGDAVEQRFSFGVNDGGFMIPLGNVNSTVKQQ